MAQHDKSAENFDQAIENIEKTCQQYIGAVSAAIVLIGLKPGALSYLLNEIAEHNSMIVTACKDAKRNIQ